MCEFAAGDTSVGFGPIKAFEQLGTMGLLEFLENRVDRRFDVSEALDFEMDRPEAEAIDFQFVWKDEILHDEKSGFGEGLRRTFLTAPSGMRFRMTAGSSGNTFPVSTSKNR